MTVSLPPQIAADPIGLAFAVILSFCTMVRLICLDEGKSALEYGLWAIPLAVYWSITTYVIAGMRSASSTRQLKQDDLFNQHRAPGIKFHSLLLLDPDNPVSHQALEEADCVG